MSASGQDDDGLGSGDRMRARYRAVARVPGILFATAALVLSVSGAGALPTLPAAPAALPVAAGEPLGAADAPAQEPVSDPPAPGARGFSTGDRLDEDGRAAFAAYVAALKAAGGHRGPAFYTSW